MSYILQIWEHPAELPRPGGMQETLTQVRALHRQRPGQNPKFLALAKKLTGRYPDLADVMAQDDEDLECAWTDSPLDGQTDRAVFNLGLALALLEKVRPFVVREATALGLCVLDEQAGEVWLADTRPAHVASAHKQAVSDKVRPSLRELTDFIFDRLKQVLIPLGYTTGKAPYSFVLQYVAGLSEILLFVYANRVPEYAEFGIAGKTRYHAVTDLVCSISEPDMFAEDVAAKRTALFPQKYWLGGEKISFVGEDGRYRVSSHAEMETVAVHMVAKLQANLLPLLQQCETLEGLAAYVFNGPIEFALHDHAQGGGAVILAHLAGRPDAAAIGEKLVEQYAKQLYRLQIAQRCLDYVRSHPFKTA